MDTLLNNASRYLEFRLFECGREQTVPDKVFSFTPKDYYLVHYVKSGSGTLVLNGKTYKLKSGDFFFFAPHVAPHYYPDPKDPWTYLWLGFGGYNAPLYMNLAGISNKNPIMHDDQDLSVRSILDRIYYLYNDVGYLDLEALGLGYQFIAKVLSLSHHSGNILNAKVRHFNSAKEFMLNNFAFDIKVEDIAKNVGVTPNYLSYIFQSVANVSTIGFLNRVRIERAATYLLTTTLPINKISKMVGIKSPLYFSNLFKKEMGVSPLNYRAKEQKYEA